jgi:DNA repair photolyase
MPAEWDYALSRQMLEVILDLGFPLFIVERSPLLLRDIDLLSDIDRKTWVGVVYSIGTLDPRVKQAFEPRSPGVRARLAAMAKLAAAGITVGTALMPVLPFITDDDAHLAEVVVATKDRGGTFVLTGGLTMSGPQALRVYEVLASHYPHLKPQYEDLYGDGAQGVAHQVSIGRRVRALCCKHGLDDRMPRWIPRGPLAVNRRVAEWMFRRMWDLELEDAGEGRVWAYRRAAWTIDELPTSVESLYRSQGLEGLVKLPGIGRRLARRIVRWLDERPRKDFE